jgi:hypothetical protein
MDDGWNRNDRSVIELTMLGVKSWDDNLDDTTVIRPPCRKRVRLVTNQSTEETRTLEEKGGEGRNEGAAKEEEGSRKEQ